MSVDTRLYVGRQWSLEDIKTVIEKYTAYNVSVQPMGSISLEFYQFYLKVGTTTLLMNVFSNIQTPLGNANLLMMKSCREAQATMKKIASILGGYFVKEDQNKKGEMIDGRIDSQDGLYFFLRYAVINKEMTDSDDLSGLNGSIKRLQERIKSKEVKTF